ncbi:MAG: glycosyltransferase, partial [bacterium]
RVVLFAAFDLFQYRKGGAFLFDALQRLFDEGRKDLLLLTAGSEQTSLGEKYKFPMQSLGQINNEKAMAVAYNAADIYAGPSLAESFGLVYLESMACATPVVAFDCTAVSEVVRHKETGYLAKTKDVDDLAQGLRLLLDDDDLRTKMGRQSRELVEREYTLKIQAKRHIKLYQQAIDKHATGKGSGQKPPGSERNGGLPQSNGKTHSRQNADDERPEWKDPESHLLKDRKGEIGYLIDRALAFRIDPRETLVVSGFWRSGTTWLQESLRELLQAKTLFEPISPLAIDAQKIIAHHQVAGKSFEFLRMFLPYCGNETLAGYPLHELFRKSLQAELRGAWVRRFRKGLAESLRPRVVVKFTRAQLCLRAAQNTFSMPVIHVYRDPRAIVASIKKTRWHWLFDHLSLRAQLLELSDGRAAYFDQWYDDIMKYDEQDPVARVAAYWSLTEKFLQHSYADCPASIAFVGYEKLVLEREKIFAEILKKLGLRPDEEHFRVQNEDSTTTSKKRQKASTEERITGWKNILSSSEIGVIESVIQHFGFEDRLVTGSKINAARLDKGVFT